MGKKKATVGTVEFKELILVFQTPSNNDSFMYTSEPEVIYHVATLHRARLMHLHNPWSTQRSCLKHPREMMAKDCLVLSLSMQKRPNCTKQNLGLLHTQSGIVSHRWYRARQTYKHHPQLGSHLLHHSWRKNRIIFCTNDMNWVKVRLLSLSRSPLLVWGMTLTEEPK